MCNQIVRWSLFVGLLVILGCGDGDLWTNCDKFRHYHDHTHGSPEGIHRHNHQHSDSVLHGIDFHHGWLHDNNNRRCLQSGPGNIHVHISDD